MTTEHFNCRDQRQSEHAVAAAVTTTIVIVIVVVVAINSIDWLHRWRSLAPLNLCYDRPRLGPLARFPLLRGEAVQEQTQGGCTFNVGLGVLRRAQQVGEDAHGAWNARLALQHLRTRRIVNHCCCHGVRRGWQCCIVVGGFVVYLVLQFLDLGPKTGPLEEQLIGEALVACQPATTLTNPAPTLTYFPSVTSLRRMAMSDSAS